MKTKVTPKFLSSSPSGKDLFEGKSHQKIANTLFKLIEKKAFPSNVIGLEGNWGAGKSNVIKILDSKFEQVESDYSFFTYDAWAHQEDLTRKTFLEELIHQLRTNSKFNGKVDWNKELEKLLARTSRSTVEKFPKIKFYWILIMGSILLFTFTSILYEDFWKPIDFLPNYSAPFFKLLLLKYLVPVFIFIWGIKEMFIEFNAFDDDEKTKLLNYKERLKRLLYIFSGSDLTSEEHEQVVENEPSVRQFKDYFGKITEDINNDGIIIVFDNMDRLTNSDKVLSLWSSIYTFFTEVKYENVYVIIPFDRKHLAQHFENGVSKDQQTIDNFLGKTFSTVFRIAPPVLSDWKKFFKIKFVEAFSDKFSDETIEFVSSLYEQAVDLNQRTPRDIITFLNNLVSLYLQHSNSIHIKYLALFALKKDEILPNPLTAISSKGFFNGEAYLFDDVQELEESLGAIVYNVGKEKATEVLLKGSIDELVRKGDLKLLQDVKNHSEFPFYFNSSIHQTKLNNIDPEGFVNILDNVEDVILQSNLQVYWLSFANSIIGTTQEETEFKEWHKTAVANLPTSWGQKLIEQLINQNKWELGKKVSPSEYYSRIDAIYKFIKNKYPDLNIDVPKVYFEPIEFIDFIDDLKTRFTDGIYKYGDFNIHCSEKDLITYFTDMESGFIKQVNAYKKPIGYLKEKQNFSFKELNDRVETEISKVQYTKTEEINQLIEILKVTRKDDTWPKFTENQCINYLAQPNNDKEVAYPYILSNMIANLTSSGPNHQIVQFLNNIELSEEVAPVIQNYLSLSDLFSLFFEKNKKHQLIKDVIQKLINRSFGFTQSLNVKWTFQNLDKIKTHFYTDNFDEFLRFFERWNHHYKKVDNESISFFGRPIIEMSLEDSYQEFKSIQKIQKVVQKDLKSKTTDEWLQIFEKEETNYFAFEKFLVGNILDSRITKSKNFMDAYSEFLGSIAKRKKEVPSNIEIWSKLLFGNYLHKGRLSKMYNDVLDYLLEHAEIKINELHFFLDGLILFSTNMYSANKIDDSIRKLILSIKKDENLLDRISNQYKEEIIRLCKDSDHQYDQNLYDMFIEAEENEILSSDIVEEIITESRINVYKEKEKV